MTRTEIELATRWVIGMEDAEFLALMIEKAGLCHLCFLLDYALPFEWMEEVWEVGRIGEFLTSNIVHDVGEDEMELDNGIVRFLAESLNCGQVVRLYVAIRDGSRQDEAHWRPCFERIFARCRRFLPDPARNPYFDYYLRGIGATGWDDEFWANDRLRKQVIEHMAFDLDRRGSTWCGLDWMLTLNRALTNEQIVRLYEDLRDCAASPEREWRGVFEEYFPGIARFLPAIRDDGADAGPERETLDRPRPEP